MVYNNVPLPDCYLNDIQLIKDSGYYLLGLITDILDLSKIEAGKLDLHRTSVNLLEIFKGVLATSTGLLKDKSIQLRPDYSDNLPLVWADPTRIRQIILNLMSNAIKFTPSGSVTLQAKAEGDFVQISVIDTGVGIPEHALTHIFDRFQQAEADTDKQYGGTGLGLDISKQLVEMHGGDLIAYSVVGQGSTFFFSLPVLVNQQLAENGSASYATADIVQIFTPNTKGYAYMILLVEDEVSMRQMMRQTLEHAKYAVTDVQDAALVQDMVSGLLPDLIVLDIGMPSFNGWQILTNLKNDPNSATVPVLVCSVNESEEYAKSLGAELYLRKPFSPDDLLACVQKLFPVPIDMQMD
jgi:CheY-like chemotaxis protein